MDDRARMEYEDTSQRAVLMSQMIVKMTNKLEDYDCDKFDKLQEMEAFRK